MGCFFKIAIDFRNTFPSAELLLFKKWKHFVHQILPIFEKKIKNKPQKEYLSQLNKFAENFENGICCIILLSLLFYYNLLILYYIKLFLDEAVILVLRLLVVICPASQKAFDKTKTVWRPNVEEAFRGFIVTCKVLYYNIIIFYSK